jgi:hypothetical protein
VHSNQLSELHAQQGKLTLKARVQLGLTLTSSQHLGEGLGGDVAGDGGWHTTSTQPRDVEARQG